MKKIFKSYFVIWAILLVVFNLIAFLSPGWAAYEKYSGSFWVGYVFVMLSFAGQLACAYKAFDADNAKKLFYGLPLFRISYTGLILSFIFGGLSMILSPIPYWIGAIVAVAVLALTAIAVVKANLAAELVMEVEEKVKAKTIFIKSLTADADSLQAHAKSDEAKAACKKVYEAVRYSDPMSHEALGAVENEISVKFSEFSKAIISNETEAVAALADEMIVLIGNRNTKCKVLK